MPQALAVGAIVGTAASGAVAFGQSRNAAAMQESVAEHNEFLARLDARTRYENAVFEARLNSRLRERDAAEARARAHAYTVGARQQETQARENVGRARDRYNRLLARNMAATAANGLALEGTPLDVLADVAADVQLELNEVAYRADVARTGLLNQASAARAGESLANFQSSFIDLEERASRSRLQSDLRNAELARLTGQARAQGTRAAGTASLISGVSQATGLAYRAYDTGALSFGNRAQRNPVFFDPVIG